jgi:hypothetical protein
MDDTQGCSLAASARKQAADRVFCLVLCVPLEFLAPLAREVKPGSALHSREGALASILAQQVHSYGRVGGSKVPQVDGNLLSDSPRQS